MRVTTGEPVAFATRREAEERWCARVRAAKFRFDLAVAQAAQAERSHDVGDAEMLQAMEQHAREEYLHELQIFTDIVVRGKVPVDEIAG